jgi:predicted enzyme related to lactoylglutathione lyase
MLRVMEVNVLFARIPVSDFKAAETWYERFFARAADVVAHQEEVMWQVTDRGWLYIVRDPGRAGKCVVAMAVSDIQATTAALAERGVIPDSIEREGDAGWKARVSDPEGNSIEIIEVAADD